MTNTSSTGLVWFITGTSSGLGHGLAISALNRGDKVIATARARSLSQLEDLKAKGAEAIELDVTAPIKTLQSIAEEAVNIYGRIDVIVNNAGYVLAGAIEENTPEETFDQFNANVFGALNVTRAFLPYMRKRRSGTIIFIGSLGGWKSTPHAGIYTATKFAIRGISMTLHDEIAPFGLRCVCIDPGLFRTSILAENNRMPWIPRITDYESMSEHVEADFKAHNGKQAGDPIKAGEIIVDLVKGEGVAKDKAFPKTLALGKDCWNGIRKEMGKVWQTTEEWKSVSQSTDLWYV